MSPTIAYMALQLFLFTQGHDLPNLPPETTDEDWLPFGSYVEYGLHLTRLVTLRVRR